MKNIPVTGQTGNNGRQFFLNSPCPSRAEINRSLIVSFRFSSSGRQEKSAASCMKGFGDSQYKIFYSTMEIGNPFILFITSIAGNERSPDEPSAFLQPLRTSLSQESKRSL